MNRPMVTDDQLEDLIREAYDRAWQPENSLANVVTGAAAGLVHRECLRKQTLRG